LSKPIAPKNILVIPLRYIGDTILTVPLIRNLRRLFPEARIDVLASRVSAPLLEPCLYLNEVIIEPKSTGERLKLLKEKRYDSVFLLRKSVSMAALCQLAGIPVRVGYDKQRFPWGYKRWGWFLTHQARYPSLKTDTPQAVSHIGLLSACGMTAQDDYLELWSTPEDEQCVDTILREHSGPTEEPRPIAVLHAASASHGKQVELNRFIPSLQALQAGGYRIFTTGTAGDAAGYETLAQEAGVPLINLAGKTSLRETFALYRRTQLLLTVDSSPIHVGAAAGVPDIVGVFGPTNERQWGPHNSAVRFQPVFRDLPCRPCYAKVCEHNNCRTQLTGEQIAAAVAKGMSGNQT
jgi:heptosyltransferase-2